MNKLTKGAIAGAAGIILLMGGAGSLAYWSDSANAGAGSQVVTAGQLKFGTAAAGTWSLNGTTITAANLASARIVPGDTVSFTQTVPFTAQGNNLKFKATTVAGTWVANSSSTADSDLAAAIAGSAQTTATTVSGTGFNSAVVSGETIYSIPAATGGTAVNSSATITVSFTFPTSTTGSTGALGAVKLNTGTGVVTLSQVA